jgi:hypothetical protein
MFAFLQRAAEVPVSHEVPGFLQSLLELIDSPLPYSPMSEYVVVLLILWILARTADKKKDFSAEAQKVLDEKYKRGEIDYEAYEKFRQELSMRLRKD